MNQQHDSRENNDYNIESFKIRNYGDYNSSANIFNNNLGDNRPAYEENYQYNSGRFAGEGNYDIEERDIEIFEDKENHIEEIMDPVEEEEKAEII
jgi:hypothetical protein